MSVNWSENRKLYGTLLLIYPMLNEMLSVSIVKLLICNHEKLFTQTLTLKKNSVDFHERREEIQ